jgi:hypothetical protein
MPQDAAGQANPDLPAPGSPPAPPRRRGRWWLVLLVTPLAPLTAGVFGWLYPSEAPWWGALMLPAGTTMHIAQKWEDGKIPERERRPRWIALEIGYAVLCGVAGPVGAWLAR